VSLRVCRAVPSPHGLRFRQLAPYECATPRDSVRAPAYRISGAQASNLTIEIWAGKATLKMGG